VDWFSANWWKDKKKKNPRRWGVVSAFSLRWMDRKKGGGLGTVCMLVKRFGRSRKLTKDARQIGLMNHK